MKNFDAWNTVKKIVNDARVPRFYKERDIWWCVLGSNIGFEQDGSVSNHARPVLIVKGFGKRVCLIIPLTTKCKNNKYYFNIGSVNKRKAAVIVSQIRLIDTKRLKIKIGVLETWRFNKIKEVIRSFFLMTSFILLPLW